MSVGEQARFSIVAVACGIARDDDTGLRTGGFQKPSKARTWALDVAAHRLKSSRREGCSERKP